MLFHVNINSDRKKEVTAKRGDRNAEVLCSELLSRESKGLFTSGRKRYHFYIGLERIQFNVHTEQRQKKIKIAFLFSFEFVFFQCKWTLKPSVTRYTKVFMTVYTGADCPKERR